MEYVTGILVFVVSWWMCFMMVLPLGVRPQDEDSEGGQKDIAPGTVSSAPGKPRILFKMGISTIGAIILTTLLIWLIEG